MKKFNKFFLILAMSFLLFSQVFAQAPQGIPYQGVARTGNGQLICNKKITLIFKIHDKTSNGSVVFEESHTPVPIIWAYSMSLSVRVK